MQHELFQAEQKQLPHPSALSLVGCAGWSLSSANKHLFPVAKSHLQSYAHILPCVEINTSFYRLHRADTYARWRDSVPDTFLFSVKLLRSITHFKRLRDCEQDVAEFLETVLPLKEKWGCLLIQFPPDFAYPGALAQEFFLRLRDRAPVDIVCEPRHETWFQDEAVECLLNADISYVEADPVPAGCGRPIAAHQPIRYIRLHGSPHIYHSSYSEQVLGDLANRLSEERAYGRKSWCIFDNTASGAAVDNALFVLGAMRGMRPA